VNFGTHSGRFRVRAVVAASVVLIFLLELENAAAAMFDWKEKWDKTLRAAEAEGQLTLYGCCYEYDRILERFKKKYPKIKVSTVLGPGGQLGARILAERRGDKYLPDTLSAGANTIYDVLYRIHALEPLKPALILPEVLDPSKWYEGEHRYIDPEKRFIFAFVANSQSGHLNITFNA
jgi:ABC-type glycerol-3-phosphate transport system substrate-binding protein